MAQAVITEITRLAGRRDECFKVPTLEVHIGADLIAEIRTSYILEADAITGSWQNGETVYLPIGRLRSPERVATIETTYAASAGTRHLPAVSFERLSDFHLVAPEPEMRSEILAYLGKNELEKGAELHVIRRVESRSTRQSMRWWERIAESLEPTGTIDLPFSRGEALAALSFELSDDILTTEAKLTIRSGIDDALHELEIAASEWSGGSVKLDPAIAQRLLPPVVQLLDELIDRLDLLNRQLSHAKYLTSSAHGVANAVKELKEASYPLSRVLKGRRLDASAGTPSWDDMRDAVATALAAASPFVSVEAVSSIDEAGRVALVTDSPGHIAIERAVMVYSTHRRTSLARLGTPAALLFMAAVMALVAWRTWYVFPLVDHNMDELEQTSALHESRESIVALLILFPALLYTQLDRVDSERLAAHRAHGMTLMLLGAGLLAPVLVAVLALGDLRPDLFATASFLTAVLLTLLALWAMLTLRDAALTERRSTRLFPREVPTRG